MFLRDRAIALVVSVLAVGSWTLAEAKKAEKAPPKPDASAKTETAPAAKPTPEQIAEWIKELDDDSSRIRDRATKDLTRAGTAAIDPVVRAAKGKSLEVTTRCIEVLKGLLASQDAKTKEAAKAALEKLAADKQTEAGRQAHGVLEAAKPRTDPAQRRLNELLRRRNIILGQVGGIQVAPGGFAFQVAVAAGNGQRDVTVNENGRKIQIKQTRTEIVVTVTEPAADNKQPKPKVYKAANAAELKKKHPDAYKLYEKYAARNQAQVVVGNLGAAPALPQGVARRVPPRRRDSAKARRLLTEAQKGLREAVNKLKAARDGKADAKTLDQILKEIEAVEKKLAEARKGLGR